MMDNRQGEAIEKIAKHYGYAKQSEQCQEELIELAYALNRMQKKTKKEKEDVAELYTSKEWENLAEELADVQIMIWQIAYLADMDFMINGYMREKIERQLKRMEE